MQIFFLFLAAVTTSLLGTALYFTHIDRLFHFYFGLIATVSALLTHVWVFFYFIGTGEGIRDGVLANHLEGDAIKRTKKFKARTFPFALFSMIFLIVTSVLGGALRFGRVAPAWHWGFAAFAILFNIFSFRQEFNTIQENRRLMDDLNKRIEAQHGSSF
jgi:hypothetical protein